MTYEERRLKREILHGLQYLSDRERRNWLLQAPNWNRAKHRFYADDQELLEAINERREASKASKKKK